MKLRNLIKYKDNRAVVNKNGESLLYSDVIQLGNIIKNDLLQRNKNGNGKIALLCDPSSSYVASQLGIWSSNNACVPLCSTHPVKEMEYYISDSKPDCIIVDSMHLPKAKILSEKMNVPLLHYEDIVKSHISSARLNDESENSKNEIQDKDDETPSLIIYTSGTTGKPKGVVSTRKNIHYQVQDLVSTWEWKSSDQILHFLPLHHVHGIINKLASPLSVGACIEFCDTHPKRLWRRISASFLAPPITVFMAVPTIYVKMITSFENELSNLEKEDATLGAKRLRLMVSGSAALPDSVFKKWEEITGHRLLERYGMSEFGMGLGNPLRPASARLPGYVGIPFPSVQVRLVDQDDQSKVVTEPNHPGLLELKGPTVFKEYLGKPEATAKEFTKDGFFKTGDVALYDKSVNSYKILGRASADIIKSGAYKISSLDIERVLLENPKIREAVVFGTPDPVYGEKINALLVLKSEKDKMDLNELKEYCKDKLPKYKIPTVLYIKNEIPKNAMGKVSKKEISKSFM